MTNWKERVLGSTHDLALDLITENFANGRIKKMVRDGEITVEEIGKSFTDSLHSILDEDE